MCGIAGIFEPAREGPVDAELLLRMTDAMTHRGPDDSGFYRGPGIGLGMRRLSIIDLENGDQPMMSEDGSIVVVFNGEIYNHGELRAQLRQRGHELATNSDTEVIAHLYEDYGLGFVEHLQGMFAIAVWDETKGFLTLARDRLGIKPLYYSQAGGRLLFGSEIKAILQDDLVDRSPDLDAIGLYLTMKYVPAPSTMFKSVNSVPPGHMVVAKRDGLQVMAYWDLRMDATSPVMSSTEYEERLGILLRETVASHLQSDVPFGSFLSGGLDSSLVTALMSSLMSEPVKTYSVGFRASGQMHGELQYASKVAQHLGTDHHELVMSGEDFVENAARSIWHLDQPIADAATVPTLLLSELASADVKMLMSGEGADELFAGYARYVGERLSPLLGFLPHGLRRNLVLFPARFTNNWRLKNALNALAQPAFVDRVVNWFPLFNDDLRQTLMADGLEKASLNVRAQDVVASALHNTLPGTRLGKMLYADTRLWLPDLLLLRGDRMTMAASVELRVPLLDHHVVEFAGSLPDSLKLSGLNRKVLLRRVADGLLPSEVLDRKKQGFPLPLTAWLRNEAKDLLFDTLADDVVRDRGLFNPNEVARLVRGLLEGTGKSLPLWGLISLELWFRQFVDHRPRVAEGDVGRKIRQLESQQRASSVETRQWTRSS